ncbi:hypothetical protein VNO77_20825 [Canavalia gladiata]|uniref:Uncharacterized protein n=1 Tax=Canavalia gladiata TaxID=3824 RepID=A0AAN9QMT9_CANGL
MERGIVAFVGSVAVLFGEMTYMPLSLSSVFFEVFGVVWNGVLCVFVTFRIRKHGKGFITLLGNFSLESLVAKS